MGGSCCTCGHVLRTRARIITKLEKFEEIFTPPWSQIFSSPSRKSNHTSRKCSLQDVATTAEQMIIYPLGDCSAIRDKRYFLALWRRSTLYYHSFVLNEINENHRQQIDLLHPEAASFQSSVDHVQSTVLKMPFDSWWFHLNCATLKTAAYDVNNNV